MAKVRLVGALLLLPVFLVGLVLSMAGHGLGSVWSAVAHSAKQRQRLASEAAIGRILKLAAKSEGVK